MIRVGFWRCQPNRRPGFARRSATLPHFEELTWLVGRDTVKVRYFMWKARIMARWAPLGLLFLIALTPAWGEENWPRFRGPNGDGVAAEAKLPTKIGDQSVLWKAAVPGVGYGSPTVWGERIFLQASSKTGEQRLFLCYSLKDGKKLWEKALPGHVAKTHAKNTLASGTPATDGERVVFASWDGSEYWLAAFSMEGKELWKRKAGAYVSQHGAGHSPILHEGRVYFVNDNDEASTVFALEGKSGAVVWQKRRPVFPASYATPLMVANGSGSKLIIASTAGIAAYDPKSGTEIWNWEWPHDEKPLRMVSSPFLAGDLLIAGCGEGGGARHMAAVQLGSAKPKLVWDLKRGIPYVPGLVPDGEHLYFVTDQGIAGCLEAKSGRTLWSQRLGGNGNVSASPVLAGGHIYECNEEGELFVFKAADSFQLVSRFKLDSGVFASPAVAGNRMVLRTRQSLYCLGEGSKSE